MVAIIVIATNCGTPLTAMTTSFQRNGNNPVVMDTILSRGLLEKETRRRHPT